MASFICRQLIGKSNHALACTRFIHSTAARFLPTVPFKLSDIGEGIAEVQVKEWHVKVGDRVAQFDNLCEVQSDKATVTITSRYDGVITKLHYNVDDTAKVGTTLIDIDVDEGAEVDEETEAQSEETKPEKSAESEETPKEAESPSSSQIDAGSGKTLAAPAVRRIAMEHNVDISKIQGTGKDGRILKEDILRHIGEIPEAAAPKAQAQAPQAKPTAAVAPIMAPPPKIFTTLKADETKPVKGYTKVMIKSMSEALKIPHFGYNDEVIMDKAIEMRNELKELSKERGIKITYTPIFIKAASLALRQFPIINGSVDEKLENITMKASHNICIAMDTPDGLIVPNIKNCEQRNIWEIAQELNRLVENARRGAVAPADLKGGTFTLSNIGAIGGTYAGPIIFPPQFAICALGKMQQLPVVTKDGKIEPAHVVKLSFAADHRFVDGATVARFSNAFKDYLEKPNLMAADLA